jgi:hypothetical protein
MLVMALQWQQQQGLHHMPWMFQSFALAAAAAHTRSRGTIIRTGAFGIAEAIDGELT